jgi:hypothetical protein
MNTRTAKNAMNEEFIIVVNPTMDDISILGPHVRFTADNRTRTVYAWPFSSGHHADVSIGLNLKDSYSCPDVFRGAALMENGTYRFVASDFLSSFRRNPGKEDCRFLRELFSNDWSWVESYITLSGSIRRLKEQFNLL